MLVIYILQVFTRSVCLPGSMECQNNMLRVCDVNGLWIQTDCVRDTECSIDEGNVGCLPKTEEGNKENVVDQLLRKEDTAGDDVDENEGKSDEGKSDEEANKGSGSDKAGDNGNNSLSKLTNMIMDKLKRRLKDKDDDVEEVSGPNRQGKPKRKHKKKKSEEVDGEADEDDSKKLRVKRANSNDRKKKVKTVLYERRKPKEPETHEDQRAKHVENGNGNNHKSKHEDQNNNETENGNNHKAKPEQHTITITKTVVQKDPQDGIDLRLSLENDGNVDKSVDSNNINGKSPYKRQASNINYNIIQPGAPQKQSQPSTNGGGSKGNGNGGASSPSSGNGGSPSSSNGGAATQGAGGSKPPTPNGGGQTKTPGSAGKPSSGASKPEGGSAGGSKPPGGGTGQPAAGQPAGASKTPPGGGGGGGSSQPSSGGAGGSSKPSSSAGSAQPSAGGAAKPSPSADSSKKAATGAQTSGGANGGSSPPAKAPTEGASNGGTKQQATSASGAGTSSSGTGGSNGNASGSGSNGGGAGGNGSGDKKPSSGGGGAVNVTADQVTQAMSESGYSPKPEYVEAIVKVTNEEIETIEMAAMFLAQTGHESGGFQYIEEIDCAGSTKCADQYGGSEGVPGKSYHGRGFIQLSWPANYKAASEALGMGDELYQNPEKVSEDPDIGAKVSSWYWKTRVETAPGVSDNMFGATTKAINGALECTGQNVDKSKNRYKIYQAVAKALGVTNLADEGGCY